MAFVEGDLLSSVLKDPLKRDSRPLVDFNQLESLDIPLPFLASFTPKTGIQLEDVVPRNIKHLRISDDLEMQEQYDWDGTSLLRAIESWLNSSRASNPNLSTISLWVNGRIPTGALRQEGNFKHYVINTELGRRWTNYLIACIMACNKFCKLFGTPRKIRGNSLKILLDVDSVAMGL